MCSIPVIIRKNMFTNRWYKIYRLVNTQKHKFMRAYMYVHTQKHTETQIYESIYVCTHAETHRNINL